MSFFNTTPEPPFPMEQIAFKMQLKIGKIDEYHRRHDEVWPEVAELLKNAGVSDYSIFVDEDTHSLFSVLRRTTNHTMDELPLEPVMQRWWAYMADLMNTNADKRPVVTPLKRVFYLA